MISYASLEDAFREADPKGEFKRWTDMQRDAFLKWDTREDQRLLLYYPTGKGKTKLSLSMVAVRGYDRVIVVAPPKTHAGWQADALTAGLRLTIMSVNTFRMAKTKLPRNVPLIVDEFHMLGRHNGVGFKKLDRMATGFPALILCSATPEYNDADRCYNVAHVMEPLKNLGGYIKWVYRMCDTSVNPFASTPIVHGFLDYDGAPDFLSKQPYTAYVEDTADWDDKVLLLKSKAVLSVFDEYGYSLRHHRMIASQMEATWKRNRLVKLTASEQLPRPELFDGLFDYMTEQGDTKYLVFSNDKIVANALATAFEKSGVATFLVTGDTTKTAEDNRLGFINSPKSAVLVGTAALATGVDGIDKVCRHLIIFDDTTDPTLRRQLIGRVLPRGDYNRDTIVTSVVTSV